MNCTEFLRRLDEYLEGSLGAEHEPAAAHVRRCPACHRRVARVRSLRMALRQIPAPAPRADLWERALARAQAEAAPAVRRAARPRWPYAAGMALAASLALWLGFGWLPGTPRAPDAGTPAVTITLHQPRVVQLAFDAREELHQASLTIRLPEGVELEGFPGEREVHWRTDLARGVNVLSLPLVAVSAGGGSLTARLEYNERITELTVPLRVANSTVPAGRSGACGAAPCAPDRREVNRA